MNPIRRCPRPSRCSVAAMPPAQLVAPTVGMSRAGEPAGSHEASPDETTSGVILIDSPDGVATVVLTVDGNDYVIPFSSIHSAKLLLTDKLINATAPLSTEGADTIQTVED